MEWSEFYRREQPTIEELKRLVGVFGMRQDFREAFDNFMRQFESDPGISWDEAIEVLEAKISEWRKTMARNE